MDLGNYQEEYVMKSLLRVTVKIKEFTIDLHSVSKVVASVVVSLLLFSCKHNPDNVEVRDVRPPEVMGDGVYIVQKGDTLYSVARHYNKDFKVLASVNEIYKPYNIFPGQKIIMALDSFENNANVSKIDRHEFGSLFVVKKNTVDDIARSVHNSHAFVWMWPISGFVKKRFSLFGKVSKGIDIQGKVGEAVFAAAPGEVVYAGNDVVSYGKLIIIKHNSRYLSTYALNGKLYVREGDSVKVSQKIAEIAVTGIMGPRLHFEIRQNGKPVNPMKYLPKQ